MARRHRPSPKSDFPRRAPLQEQLLIDQMAEFGVPRVLCTSVGRGQFGIELAQAQPQTSVTCHCLDLFYANETRATTQLPNFQVALQPDFPDGEFEAVALPLRSSGDAELARERLQAGHQALTLGGRLVTSTDNTEDTWLHEEMRKLFPKVTRRPVAEGVVYLATKTAPLKKLKNFDCQFAFRDQGRLIQLVSRPGVFSHRKLDGGARALLNALDIDDGVRVLDMGCGSGGVGLGAACRGENVQVLCVDSDSRAIQCVERGAALNNLKNVRTELNCTGDPGQPASFDVALGNPPYFSQYHIAELFLRAASRALVPGGLALMVTKTPQWYLEHMPRYFEDVEAHPGVNYSILVGVKG